MGNHQTLINYHSPLNYAQDLNEQLIDQGMIQHPGLGQIQLWKMKEINKPHLFSFYVHIYEKDSSIIEIHNFRSFLKHPNLIEYFACTHSQILNIGRVQSQQFFFAYYEKTLKELIKSTSLKEVQIWNLTEQIVDVMVYLQKMNRYHGNISSDSIFITDQFQIKLLDKIGQNPGKVTVKDDVYDLGILMIELLTKKTNQLNFIQQIKNLHGKFSLQLLQLVAKMLDEKVDKRPDFIQIQKMIQHRFKEPIFFNNLEKNGDQNNLTKRLSKQELQISQDMQQTQHQSPLRNYQSDMAVPYTFPRHNTNPNMKENDSKNPSPIKNQFQTEPKNTQERNPYNSTEDTRKKKSPSQQRLSYNQNFPLVRAFNIQN